MQVDAAVESVLLWVDQTPEEMRTVTEDFSFDIFLRHGAKDKAVVQAAGGAVAPGRAEGVVRGVGAQARRHSTPSKIEEGLDHSRVLVLCMPALGLRSDWGQFWHVPASRPAEPERRFIPLRLGDAPIKASLAQFLYIDWRPAERQLNSGLFMKRQRLETTA